MADAIIAAQEISKRFGSVEVLRGVNLAVAQGDVVCIIGPSGSGKTTLLRCFALLEAPSGEPVDARATTPEGHSVVPFEQLLEMPVAGRRLDEASPTSTRKTENPEP